MIGLARVKARVTQAIGRKGTYGFFCVLIAGPRWIRVSRAQVDKSQKPRKLARKRKFKSI